MLNKDEFSAQMKQKFSKIARSNLNKKDQKQIDDAIRNRESWIKGFLIIFPVVIIGWKILRSPASLVGTIDARDLLFVVLALFSISLSALFYLKATSAVKQSYEQMMQIMQEMLSVAADKPAPARETQSTQAAQKSPQIVHNDRSPQDKNPETADKFYEILFTQVSFTDVMNYDRAAVDQKFGERAKSLPTQDLEFLLENRYITNDWKLSNQAHSLIMELKDKFRMKAIV